MQTHSSLQCQMNDPFGGDVLWTVEGCVQYEAPAVDDVVPLNAPTSGGSLHTITGRNFGPPGENSGACTFTDFSTMNERNCSGVQIGGTVVKEVTWVSHTSIIFRPQALVGRDLSTTVEVLTQSQSCTNTSCVMRANTPQMVEVAPSYSSPVSEARFTVSGSSFGVFEPSPDSDPLSLDKLKVIIGKSESSSVKWISDTSAEANLPSGVGRPLVSVSRAEVEGTEPGLNNTGIHNSSRFGALFSYKSPKLESFTFDHGPTTGGSKYLLYGEHFGQQNEGLVVKIGHTECGNNSLEVNDGVYVCETPMGIGGNLTLKARVGHQTGEWYSGGIKRYFSFSAPVLTGVLPYGNISAAAQSVVTLLGESFGVPRAVGEHNATNYSVLVGSTAADVTRHFTDTALSIRVEPGVGFSAVTVRHDGEVSGSSRVIVTYQAPVVEELSRDYSSNRGGIPVTLYGRHFGSTDYSAIAVVGGTECVVNEWTADT